MTQSTFSAQVANKYLTILQGYSKTIRLLLVMFLTLTASAVWGADETATLSFANKAQRTSFSTTKQVWEQNDVTFTNNKSSSITNVADYANPVRLYANSSVTIDCSLGNMTKIVFDCSSNSYATAMKNSIGSSATASSDKVTVTLDGTSNTFTVAKLSAQVRLDGITVTYATAATATEYNITYVGDEHITYTGTKPETIKKEDDGFELEFSVNDGYQLNDVQVKMGGQNLVVEDDYYWEEGYLLILPEKDITGDIVITFVTVSTCTTSPTVSAGSNSNVTTTTATVSCSSGITSLGSAGCPIESYGFVYGTSSNPTISNTKEQVGTTYTTTGTAFTKELTGLTANTTYYVRPYATNGNGTAYGTQTSFKTLELPKYTVTLNADPGTCAASVTETSAGAGVELPTPTLDCGDWEFAGWTTSSVATETSSKPATLLTGTYKPASNVILYAVYQRTEETEGGSSTPTTTSDIFENRGTYTAASSNAKAYITWTEANVVSIKQEQGSSTSAVNSSYVKDPRWYKSHNITITPTAKIAYITITAQSNDYATALANSTYTNATASVNNSTVTITPTDGNKNITISMGAQARLFTLTVTYYSGDGGSSSTTYYNSNPVCKTCENVLTISKGTESNGTFTLSKSGEIKTCDGVVDVVVTPIPAEHYHIGSVTATTPTTGGAPTMTGNDDGTWTVNYARDSKGESTINVTFAEDAKATIKLYELGVLTTIATEYVGDKYTLPTTSSQSCEGKQLVGWSTVEVVETDTKPTENYYELGATVTLEAEQTFYAVFAEPTGNGGAEGELFSESFETIEGSGGNDGKWDGNIASAQLTEHGDWEFTYAYKGYKCIKLGKASGQGQATTPALGINGSATLTFAAGAWNAQDEKTQINLTIVGEGSIEPSSVTLTKGQFNTYTANITGANADTKVQFIAATKNDNRFFLDEVKVSGGTGNTTYTDYSTSCGIFTITYYGFNSGGYTTTCNDNPAVDEVEQGGTYVIPNCEPTFDPAKLGRTFAGTWNTQANGKGTAYKPGDEIVNVCNDITLYAQWALNTSEENTTLPTDVEDLATTDVVVTGGTILTLKAGTTTINSLTLKGGLQENGAYAMPVVNIPEGATLVRNNNKINLDLKVNNKSYYPFAVPFEVENTAANVNYINPTLKEYANANKGYGKYYRILEYDGAKRAEKGLNNDSNWVHVGRTDVKLMPGKGYAISAVPAAGDDTVTIRITMTVDNEWLANGEQKSITVKEQTTTRNAVAVTAYTGAAANKDICNAGWNFVANPYLTNFTTNNHITGVDYIGGEIIVSNGQFVKDGTEVPYVTIPNANMSWYEQRRVQDAILSPMYSFFVQIAEGSTMTFTTDGRQQAPAALRASSEQANPSFEADIVILNNQEQVADHTGLVINDRWTPAYEIGGDLEKMFGNANRTAIYTLSGNTRLAYNALSYNDALVAIPVGFRAQANGEYTIQLRNTEDIEDVESIELKDLYNNQTTNLLYNDYTFYSDATQEDSRFVVYLVPKKNTTTDISTITNGNTENRKIIFNNHLYIIHNGNIYNGTGQMVK